MSKHTPGPWAQSHRAIPNDPNGMWSTQIYDTNGKTIADVAWYAVQEGNVISTSREANARLIAAAPDLLREVQNYYSLTGAERLRTLLIQIGGK
jgi:hypothetical protein